jgi:outer membrane protein assembly factor BamD
MRRWLSLALLVCLSGCGKQVQLPTSNSGLVERDKELYEQAIKALAKNRFTVAQLQLQTLLETYEDSEFSAQAKYAYADTFYFQAGHSNLLAAESEFRKFITFFPTHELADDAQLKIAMTHIKQLQKPDRDDTEARLAELELNAMITDPNYSESPLLDEAKEKLRAVQEILAESILGPAKQYYMRRAYPAVVDRCQEILKKYPDFSGTDRVLFLLGETTRKLSPEHSSAYYAQIVRDYPLSPLVKDAKKQLVELQAAVPEPNPLAMDRAKQQQVDGKGVFSLLSMGLFGGGGPEISRETKAASAKDPSSILAIPEGQ